MKTTASPKDLEVTYPCLKIAATGLIVLFTRPRAGVAVVADGYSKVGQYNDGINGWNESVFEPFIGTVTLEN